jgi:rhodanese-related sulfurtransferase
MRKTYIIVIISAVLLGLTVALLPANDNSKELSPDEMLLELLDETRFFSSDEVAQLIISGDPSILLIDVRTPEEYAEFTLSGAINIPLDSIMNEDYEYIINQQGMKNILFSNGTIYANQAWFLTKRLNYNNIYVLKGGLNNWFETIITPDKPESTKNQEAIDLYEFRKGAMQYFTGGGEIIESETSDIKVEIKKTEKKTGGGC